MNREEKKPKVNKKSLEKSNIRVEHLGFCDEYIFNIYLN